MKKKISQMVRKRIQPRNQVIYLITQKCERNVELRIIRGKCAANVLETRSVSSGIIYDKKTVIPRNKGVGEYVPIHKKKQCPKKYKAAQSLFPRRKVGNTHANSVEQ